MLTTHYNLARAHFERAKNKNLPNDCEDYKEAFKHLGIVIRAAEDGHQEEIGDITLANAYNMKGELHKMGWKETDD